VQDFIRVCIPIRIAYMYTSLEHVGLVLLQGSYAPHSGSRTQSYVYAEAGTYLHGFTQNVLMLCKYKGGKGTDASLCKVRRGI